MRYDRTLETWQEASHPVSGPAFSWPSIDVIIIHYRGSGSNPVPKDIQAHLRAAHRGYLNDPKRGYSYGYNTTTVL